MGVRLVLLGPPGAGKGTLARWLEERLTLPHLSTGELFRQEIRRHSALGRAVGRYVTSGRLVPDALVVKVMTSRLTRRLRQHGFVLDGFPRTVGQATGLDRFLQAHHHPLHGAVHLVCPKSLLVRRLTGRRVCERCGANYHIQTMRPRRPGLCDRCNGPLVLRKDDAAATVRKRLQIDRAQARPLLAYYRERQLLYPVNGEGSDRVVFRRVVDLMQRQRWTRVDRHDPTTAVRPTGPI